MIERCLSDALSKQAEFHSGKIEDLQPLQTEIVRKILITTTFL